MEWPRTGPWKPEARAVKWNGTDPRHLLRAVQLNLSSGFIPAKWTSLFVWKCINLPLYRHSLTSSWLIRISLRASAFFSFPFYSVPLCPFAGFHLVTLPFPSGRYVIPLDRLFRFVPFCFTLLCFTSLRFASPRFIASFAFQLKGRAARNYHLTPMKGSFRTAEELSAARQNQRARNVKDRQHTKVRRFISGAC